MRKIILSKQASDKLEKLLDYLETEWSERMVGKSEAKFHKEI